MRRGRVELAKPAQDDAKITLQPGYQRLTGGAALDFVRFRHTDSDFFRVARQQQFVKAIRYQLKHKFSVTSLPALVNALTHNVEVGVGVTATSASTPIPAYTPIPFAVPLNTTGAPWRVSVLRIGSTDGTAYCKPLNKQ